MTHTSDSDRKGKKPASEGQRKPAPTEKKKADPQQDEKLIEERLRSLGYL